MIGVVDYGAGNLQSVANALDRLGLRFVVCAAADDLRRADRVLLPGVGHFGAAARRLAASGLGDAVVRRVRDEGAPLLGICLGLQLLLDGSDEAPGARGLGLVPGRSVRLSARTVPHTGWNRVVLASDGPLEAVRGAHVYFAHEFVAAPERPADVLATAELDGEPIPVAIGGGPVLGVQFHPEKSDRAGLALLEAFGRC